MQASLERIDTMNHNARTLWFKPAIALGYTAGQFIEMYLPHDNPDDRGQKRWFTLSSSPSEELVSITTKFNDKSSSFKRVLGSLGPGGSVELSEAMGDFVLPKDASIPLVFIAGGIGVTPFRSMVKWLVDNDEQRSLEIILGAATAEDVLFADLFKEYGADPTVVLSHPDHTWHGETGNLSGEKLLEIMGSSSDKRIYISGPEQMVEDLQDQLKKLGVTDDQLVGDFFPGYGTV